MGKLKFILILRGNFDHVRLGERQCGAAKWPQELFK